MQFLEMMAMKDPQWQDRMKLAQEKEVARIKVNQQRLEQEIQAKQLRLKEEMLRKEELRQLRATTDERAFELQ
jgi:hypothetical protein